MAAFFPIQFRILNLEFPIKVVSGCCQTEVSGPAADGTMTVRILSTGVARTANAEVRGILARYYNVPKSAVEIQDRDTGAGQRVKIAVSMAATEALSPTTDHELDETPALARA